MLDKVTITPRARAELGDAAQERVEISLQYETIATKTFAAIDVIPQRDQSAPRRPFLHCGDWMDDGQGNIWTVLTALLHEDDEDDGTPYLWHEYEVVGGMHAVS